ncbi:acyl-coenzyme A synthetase ACSM4, mitochondrial-like [Sphaerodactylus townsendi]|uniref:acyl-coenzyme A synthetase ACSM4, mitochondrial-like n=1 Tax=Sphaerodactylus townsendi TaxID=933632 RepID=UPI00202738F8|nr:acyl-coenzyme A synthetase ACSM4, mitochondrial-like [Sphaerodactylus townsendi]
MKTLVKLWAPRPIWNPKLLWKSFRKDGRASASLDLAELEAINRCEKEVPEYFNFANDVLDKWSQIEKEGNRPPNPALWWINGKGSEVRWSYEELAALSRKAANVLMDPCGLQRGDRVILILPRVPEWWLLNAACIRTGIIFIPGTPLLTAKDILFRLQASKAKGIITNENLAPVVDSVSSSCPFLRTKLLVSEGKRGGWLNFKELLRAAPSSHDCVKTKSDEPMTIYFTSGTTGSPKMAEHTHSSFGIGCALPARYWLDLKPSDIMWNMSDTGWIKAAIGSVFAPWLRGSSVFIHHMPQFDPREILNTLVRYPVTTMCSAPTGYRMLVQQDLTGTPSYRFKSLKHCSTGGESLNPEVLVQWKKQTGLDLYEGYGQTEVGVISLMEKGKEIKPGSMGKPVASYDVQIIDANSANILASHTGREGEIKAIRIQIQAGPNFITFFTAHVDNPEKTASTFRGNFYLTGDRGWMDEDGYLWFVARADDVIMSSGYRIGPSEVENALIEHPAVVESAVVSSPDAIRGEVVKAYVVLSPSFASHDKEELTLELQDHVKKTTAPYKYPRKVEFVHQLPKTVSGKIRRNELRKKEWEQIKHGTHIW